MQSYKQNKLQKQLGDPIPNKRAIRAINFWRFLKKKKKKKKKTITPMSVLFALFCISGKKIQRQGAICPILFLQC